MTDLLERKATLLKKGNYVELRRLTLKQSAHEARACVSKLPLGGPERQRLLDRATLTARSGELAPARPILKGEKEFDRVESQYECARAFLSECLKACITGEGTLPDINTGLCYRQALEWRLATHHTNFARIYGAELIRGKYSDLLADLSLEERYNSGLENKLKRMRLQLNAWCADHPLY